MTIGFDEIEKRYHGMVWGFNYINPEIMELMQEFQHQYLNHVNPYTRLAYKEDPAVLGVLITNENDVTQHIRPSPAQGKQRSRSLRDFHARIRQIRPAVGPAGGQGLVHLVTGAEQDLPQ